jgi:hypothetical protein
MSKLKKVIDGGGPTRSIRSSRSKKKKPTSILMVALLLPHIAVLATFPLTIAIHLYHQQNLLNLNINKNNNNLSPSSPPPPPTPPSTAGRRLGGGPRWGIVQIHLVGFVFSAIASLILLYPHVFNYIICCYIIIICECASLKRQIDADGGFLQLVRDGGKWLIRSCKRRIACFNRCRLLRIHFMCQSYPKKSNMY